MDWIKRDIKPTKNGRYLTILYSNARAQHYKGWTGIGTPEISIYNEGYEGLNKWNSRGSLSVAFWMPLPEFDLKWNKGKEGEQGFFESVSSKGEERSDEPI